MFGTITLQLEFDEHGSIVLTYFLSGDNSATKPRQARLTPDTVATDVAQILAKAVPLLTPPGTAMDASELTAATV